MLSRFFLCTACTALIAIPALADDRAPLENAEPVACSGAFGPESSEALLVETFGADNVKTGLVYGPEGSEYIATTVYPGDPAREMVFSWFDEDKLETPSVIELSRSQSLAGVQIGMTVAEVEAANGAKFEVGGFWWDYGGGAPIDEGALSGQLDGGCYPSFRFAPMDDIPASINVTAVLGEVVVPSDEPLLAEIDARVSSVSLGYSLAERE